MSRGAVAESIDVLVKASTEQFDAKVSASAAASSKFAGAIERDMARVEQATAKSTVKAAASVAKFAAEIGASVAQVEADMKRLAVSFGQGQQMAWGRDGMVRSLADHRRAGAGGRGVNIAGAAYGLSDAATAYQFNGLKGAAIGVSNNLPMMGQALSDVAGKFAKVGGAAGSFATILMRFAGPAGLVASIALPLAMIFLPKLFETESALEKAKKATDEFGESLKKLDEDSAKRREMADAWKAVSKGGDEAKTATEKQKEEVRKLKDEYDNAKTAHASMVGAAAGLSSDEDRTAADAKIKESERVLKERKQAYEKANKELSGMEARRSRLSVEENRRRVEYEQDQHELANQGPSLQDQARQKAADRNRIRNYIEDLDAERKRLESQKQAEIDGQAGKQREFATRQRLSTALAQAPQLSLKDQGAESAITQLLNARKQAEADGKLERDQLAEQQRHTTLLERIDEKIGKVGEARTKAAKLL